MNAHTAAARLRRSLLAFLALAAASDLTATPDATLSAPSAVNAGQSGYAASVRAQPGCTYAWTLANGSIAVGQGGPAVGFTAGATGLLQLACTVTEPSGASATGQVQVPVQAAPPPAFHLGQCLQDGAQRTTLAFSGLALITGNLPAQSFFPPGKVADYWGFQFLRDNDPDGMGHNTSFLTRIACNVLFILDETQLSRLKELAAAQVESINAYGLERYTLLQAFRRTLDGDLPDGSPGLSEDAVARFSRDLYLRDGDLSFARAAAFADLYRSLSPDQIRYLGAMAGLGWQSWPAKSMNDVRSRLAGLAHDQNVAVMTYAGDFFSWYVGSLEADVYFCPERHGTYYGGFYIKDAPAMGREGYSIDEQLTATAGSALCDSARGYVSPAQAALLAELVGQQRDNLYAGNPSIVGCREAIASALRTLIRSTAPSPDEIAAVRTSVLDWSGVYGELDGRNNFHYVQAFTDLNDSLDSAQRTALAQLRRSIMSGTYSDGTSFDFSVCSTPFLYSAVIPDDALLARYLAAAEDLFEPGAATPPWGTRQNGWLRSPLGWTYDSHFPFIYLLQTSSFAWVAPTSTLDSLWCYLLDGQNRWVFASANLPGWCYQFGGPSSGWIRWE